MASENINLASPPAAHVVGKAFVEQYYQILHRSPDMVHKFYQDSSILARPDTDGSISSVTTMQAINEKVISMNYEDYKFEIETVDAHDSFKGGVLVLVTGSLVGNDNILRKFTQSFFLAPQETGGYFVLNDVFRYVHESQTKENACVQDDITNDLATNTSAAPDPESTKTSPEKESENGADVSSQLENGGFVVEESVEQPIKLDHHDATPAPELTTTSEEDAPKKSYASIVKVMKGSSPPSNVHLPSAKVRVTTPMKTEKPAPAVIPVPAPEAAAPSKSDVNENSPQEEVEGYSIYVRNLPLNATPADVEEEFKKFGSIKSGGVQVRNHKQYGYCFGFVEFESESSMQAAIEAAPILMGTQRVIVETKRTTTRVDGSGSNMFGRGQFPQGRGGFRNEARFRNDNFRGRGGGFNLGQGYVRNEFRSRGGGGFPSRGRLVSARPVGVHQNGGARVFRPGGMSQVAIPA